MKKRYEDCQRADGMCVQCSLMSKRLDCHNKKINGILYNRTALNMTQSELAEKSGVYIRQIQKYESGEYYIGNMTLRNALSLSCALECDVESLF